MYCEKCGQKLGSDEKFCSYCGTRVLSFSGEGDEALQENMQMDVSDVPKKKKTAGVLITGLAALAVALSAAVFFIWNFVGNKKNPVNGNMDSYTDAGAGRDSSTDILTNEPAETQMEEPGETKAPAKTKYTRYFEEHGVDVPNALDASSLGHTSNLEQELFYFDYDEFLSRWEDDYDLWYDYWEWFLEEEKWLCTADGLHYDWNNPETVCEVTPAVWTLKEYHEEYFDWEGMSPETRKMEVEDGGKIEGYKYVTITLTCDMSLYYSGLSDRLFDTARATHALYDWYTGKKFPGSQLMIGGGSDSGNMDLEIDGETYDISYWETSRWDSDDWRYIDRSGKYSDGTGEISQALCNVQLTQSYGFWVPEWYDGLVFAAAPEKEYVEKDPEKITGGYAPLDKNDENYVEGTEYFRINRKYDENYVESPEYFRFNQNGDGLKAPTESPDGAEPAINAETGQLSGVGAESPSAPATAEDFIRVSSPDGAYTFMYPRDYFYRGVYDQESGSYYFETADNSLIVEFYKIDAPVPGSPYESAERMYENLKGDFLEGAECPYVYRSKGVADDGYSRMIISGPYAEMTNGPWATYYCTSSNDDTTYIMQVQYVAKDQNGTGVENTPTGYLLDCLYRGWSLSGSTYEIRSYAQYMAHDMGAKKPGES